ncbi:MAG: nucleotide sugar epimerase, partial [Anaerolineae bacterium]
RGFTYVDDIARGVILALQPVGYEIFNLGGHEDITIRELIERIERLVGRKAHIVQHPFPQADMKSNLADVSKAGRILGWEAHVSLDEGLRRTVDWYNANRAWAKELSLNV